MDPSQVPELGRALRVIGEHGDNLTRDTPADKLAEIARDLGRALEILGRVTGPRPHTDCPYHPFGAVDIDAPDKCFLCEQGRRKAKIAAQGGGSISRRH